MMIRWLALLFLFVPLAAHAQTAQVVAACSVPNSTYPVGSTQPITMDTTGRLCSGGAGPGGSFLITPGPRTIIPLDVSSVTTGGTAVTALAAGHAMAGGFVETANVAGICVDQHTAAGTVTGTPSTTACVATNVPFYIVPSAGAVSVNSSASSVSFGGEGLN